MANRLPKYESLNDVEDYEAWARKMGAWFIYVDPDGLIKGEWTALDPPTRDTSMTTTGLAERFRTANKKLQRSATA